MKHRSRWEILAASISHTGNTPRIWQAGATVLIPSEVQISLSSNIFIPLLLGKSQRLRPLYQYINYDNPEMNSPSDKESDLPQLEVPSALENKTGLLETRITPPKGNKWRIKRKGCAHSHPQIQQHSSDWNLGKNDGFGGALGQCFSNGGLGSIWWVAT